MSGALGVACVERYGDASVALVALHSVADWRRCYTNLEKLAGMQEAVFGLSDPFDDLLNASDAYEDARYATLACLKHPHTTTGSDNDRPGPSSPPSHSIDFSRTSGTCLAYDDCKMDLLREGLRRQVSPYNITPLRFKCMQDYDRSNGTDYLVTVLEYARNLRHHTRACESLSIHRGTLDYRLKKVRQLFGIDVDSPDTLADIHLLYEAGALSIEEKHSE